MASTLIIFDVGGTLIYADDFFIEAARRLGQENLSEAIKKEFWSISSRNNFLSEEQVLILASESIAERHGLDASVVAGLINELLLKTSYLMPHAFETLSFFHESGCDMIIASDSDHDILIKELKRHDIHKFFKEIITSSKAKAYKPSDEFVGYLAESLKKFSADNIFFVGDSDADIQSALKLDVTPIFFASSNQKHNFAAYNIQSLDQLKDIINIK